MGFATFGGYLDIANSIMVSMAAFIPSRWLLIGLSVESMRQEADSVTVPDPTA